MARGIGVKRWGETIRGELRELLPPEIVAEAIKDVLPREEMSAAFREGLALLFSPFAGFWCAIHEATRGPGRRRKRMVVQ